MITVKVKWDGRRLNRLAKNIGFVSGRQFIQRSSLLHEKNLIMAFLKRTTPRSIDKSNKKEFGKALADAWKVRISKKDFVARLTIENAISSMGPRGRVVYRSIQLGSGVVRYLLPKNVTFLDRRGSRPKSVFLREGYEMIREPRPGIDTRGQVDAYVDRILQPVIRRKVKARLSEAITAIETLKNGI